MYKAIHKGTAKGKSGKQYFYNIDDTFDVPKDEINGAYGLVWEGRTKKDIMKALDEKGIEYDGRKSKESLAKLL